jgi:transposase InsO family protein
VFPGSSGCKIGVYDNRHRCSGRELVQRVPRLAGCGPTAALGWKAEQEGHTLRAAAGTARLWHIDIAHTNIHGTFYSLCRRLDGASRYLLAWDLLESMTEADVETIPQRARERFPEARPRIISDNGPQFIAKNLKEPSYFREDAER